MSDKEEADNCNSCTETGESDDSLSVENQLTEPHSAIHVQAPAWFIFRRKPHGWTSILGQLSVDPYLVPWRSTKQNLESK